jgi:hypothetical protein
MHMLYISPISALIRVVLEGSLLVISEYSSLFYIYAGLSLFLMVKVTVITHSISKLDRMLNADNMSLLASKSNVFLSST